MATTPPIHINIRLTQFHPTKDRIHNPESKLVEDRHTIQMYEMLKGCKYILVYKDDATEELLKELAEAYPKTTVIIDDTGHGIDSMSELTEWASKATGPVAQDVREKVMTKRTPVRWIGETASDRVYTVVDAMVSFETHMEENEETHGS